MGKKDKLRSARAKGVEATPTAVLSSRRGKPSSSARFSDHSSEDEDTGEAAKFDVSTIPIHRLTLHDEALKASSDVATGVPETDPAKVAEVAEVTEVADKGSAEAATEGEGDKTVGKKPMRPVKPVKPFPLLHLPSELRVRVYRYHFEGVEPVLDLTPDNYRRVHRKLALLRTCRHVYVEASHFFYSSHVFRIFPTYPGRFFKTRRPLLARLRGNQRADLTALELRLGPGFNKPPKCWVVNRKLGLHECVAVRKIHVFVQLDPSVSWLDGFRKPGFYEAFSRGLLDDILSAVRTVEVVEFDAYESVRKSAPIMQALVQTAMDHGKKIAWGPRNGWSEAGDNEANSRLAAGVSVSASAASAASTTPSTTTTTTITTNNNPPSIEDVAALLDQSSELVVAA